LAILELRLINIPPRGSSFPAIYSNLDTHFAKSSPGRRLFHMVHVINVIPEDRKSLDDHQKALSAFIQELNREGVKRLLLLVNTHCNPENGDLHCANDTGITAEDVSFDV